MRGVQDQERSSEKLANEVQTTYLQESAQEIGVEDDLRAGQSAVLRAAFRASRAIAAVSAGSSGTCLEIPLR